MTRMAIVDPQPAARAGLAMLLRAEPGLVPVGSATGAHGGADLAERRNRTWCSSSTGCPMATDWR